MAPGLLGIGRLQGQNHDADKPDGSDNADDTNYTHDADDTDHTGADRDSH